MLYIILVGKTNNNHYSTNITPFKNTGYLIVITYINNPLDQFEIRNLISIDGPLLLNLNISLTNIGLYLLLASSIIMTFSVLTLNRKVIFNA